MITGGAGFIGSHLTERLAAEGHEVHIADCLHSYYSPERKQQQLKRIEEPYQFHFIDLLDREKTAKLFQETQPEAVVHLAALPGVAYSIEEPLKYVDYDIKATINVLEASGKAGAKQVLFASSSSVYGNQEGPFKEQMANGKVISPYAASKYSAESFCHVYQQLYGFDMKILRFFTAYGPWGRPDMAIGIFIRELSKGNPITVFDQGTSRDYTYVSDIVNGICLTLFKLKGSETLNLGSASPVSMDQLLDEMKHYFPNMQVNRKPARPGDVHATWANTEKAKELLGFETKVSFSDGLAKTMAWARSHERYL